MAETKKCKGLLERLKDGESVVVAEGYIFAFERRCYLKAGPYVPEVVLLHPELVRQQHEEFVHAGSDVVLAFTYYGHREKMRLIGKEDQLEELNRKALRIAREVADKNNCLMAGNICNTTIYKSDGSRDEELTAIFKEQIEWAVEEGADYIVAETFSDLGEGKLALAAIKEYGKGLPAVITFSAMQTDTTHEGIEHAEALRQLEELGADVVGLNCHRGPETMLPALKKIRAVCKGPIAALPVPYRTSEKEKNFMSLTDPDTGNPSFPSDLDRWYCGRTQIKEFGAAAKELGIQYVGLCCGSNAGQLRALSQGLGKSPPANAYATDMSQHFVWSTTGKFSGRDSKIDSVLQATIGANVNFVKE